MSKRRGLKTNPFEKGERVKIWPLNRIGVVVEVIPPTKARGHMRYTVEWTCSFNGEESETFPGSQLSAVED